MLLLAPRIRKSRLWLLVQTGVGLRHLSKAPEIMEC